MKGIVQPVRLQLSRHTGFRLHKLSFKTNGLPAVNVARPGRWGNPFVVGRVSVIGDVIDNATAYQFFEAWLKTTVEGRQLAEAARRELRGFNLACWCNFWECNCHASTLLRIANAR